MREGSGEGDGRRREGKEGEGKDEKGEERKRRKKDGYLQINIQGSKEVTAGGKGTPPQQC